MKTIEFPMFRENKVRVQLAELLNALREDQLIWSIIEFDGVGQMPDFMSFSEFQEKIDESSKGLIMSFEEMKQFANSVEYIIDCLIVGVKDCGVLSSDSLLSNDFSSCEFVLRAIDSTHWMLGAKEEKTFRELTSVFR